MLLLSPLPLRAQLPEQVAIEWTDDAACPRPLRLSLESEVARLLGPSAQTTEPAEFEARVERLDDRESAEKSRTPYRLTLRVRSETHRAERQMDLSSCAEAQDAAALLIATAIDPEAVMRERPAPEPPPKPEPERTPPATPARWSLVLRGLFDLHSLPKPSGGPSAGVLFSHAQLRAWAEARYLFARRETEPGQSAPFHSELDLFAAAVGGAYVWPFGSLVVGPAAELELGALRSRGAGGGSGASAQPSAQLAPWILADFGAVAGYPVQRRVSLELSMFAGVPLSRPRLAVRDEQPFYTTASVTMRVAVGVRVSLGSN